MGLLVKTKLQKSTIPEAGLGCFAAEDIKKDTLIWKFNPIFEKEFDERNLRELSALEKEFIRIYAYRDKGKYILCTDNAKFFNHNDERCNTYERPNETYANTDIREGEELLCEYSQMGTTKEDAEFNIKF